MNRYRHHFEIIPFTGQAFNGQVPVTASFLSRGRIIYRMGIVQQDQAMRPHEWQHTAKISLYSLLGMVCVNEQQIDIHRVIFQLTDKFLACRCNKPSVRGSNHLIAGFWVRVNSDGYFGKLGHTVE